MRFLLVFLLFLFACTRYEPECSEEIACAFGSVCVDGTCEAQTCATSEQCGIEQYCDNSTCVDGCAADSDCRFGDTCDTEANTCTSAACTDTHLDCNFGEFCSPAGECYDAAGYYCKECSEDGDCGGNGNLCINRSYCGVTCESTSDCPASFECIPVSDFNGNVIANQCYTSCSLYEDN